MKKDLIPYESTRTLGRSCVEAGRLTISPPRKLLIMSVSSHVSARIYFPDHVFSFNRTAFFMTPSQNTVDAVYENAMRFLDKTLDDEAFQ